MEKQNSSFLTCIRHLLIDLDGVLYRGNAALPGAEPFMRWLRQRGITFQLITNNATLTPEAYVQKLAAMGIEVEPGEMMTSALATALFLREQGQQGRSAFVIGEEGLVQALQEVPLRFTAERPDWVIAGLDRQLTYQKLSAAALALEAGARFIGTNPDTSLPSEAGLLPGAGAIQAALVATTGVQPTIIGKPQPLMLELAMHRLGGTAQDTAVLGDRLDTDIAAANAVHAPSILVLTGVSTRTDLQHSAAHPSLLVDNLEELMATWPGENGTA